jgi:1,4-dihydroxy-2-naphthoate octaprenyltransferase
VISAALSIFSPYYLIALISAPLAIKSVRSVKQGASGMELVDLLAKTGRIQIIYAAALSLAALLVAR